MTTFMMQFDNSAERIIQHSANNSQTPSIKTIFSSVCQLKMNKLFWTKTSLILVSKLIQNQTQVFHQRYDKAICLSSVHYKVAVYCLIALSPTSQNNITNLASAESWKHQQ